MPNLIHIDYTYILYIILIYIYITINIQSMNDNLYIIVYLKTIYNYTF